MNYTRKRLAIAKIIFRGRYEITIAFPPISLPPLLPVAARNCYGNLFQWLSAVVAGSCKRLSSVTFK